MVPDFLGLTNVILLWKCPIVYSPKEPKDNHSSTNAMTTCATVMTDHTQRIGKLLPYIASMVSVLNHSLLLFILYGLEKETDESAITWRRPTYAYSVEQGLFLLKKK